MQEYCTPSILFLEIGIGRLYFFIRVCFFARLRARACGTRSSVCMLRNRRFAPVPQHTYILRDVAAREKAKALKKQIRTKRLPVLVWLAAILLDRLAQCAVSLRWPGTRLLVLWPDFPYVRVPSHHQAGAA